MSNRVRFGMGTLAGLAALIVLGFGLNFVISQLRGHSNAASETTAPDTDMPVSSVNAKDRLLAFTKVENGNSDIFTIHPDGSGLTNLTNDPAYDGHPFWSPDGKYIAFESYRSGLPQVYVMDSNGSNITQITNNEAAHSLPLNIDGRANPWSPDGSKLLFLQQNPDEGTWTLGSISINGGDKISIVTDKIRFDDISWSPDGNHIGFILNTSQSTNENDFVPEIYIANANGGVPWMATEFLQQNDQFYDRGYTWSPDGQAIIFKAFLQTTNPQWSIYEVRLDDHSASEKYSTESFLIDWHDDISLTMPEDPETTFIWQRPDGTNNTLDWGAACWGFNFERSLNSNFAIGAYCPDNKSGFYWVNSDGSTIKSLLGPLSDDIAGDFREISFSPDDQYITTTIATSQSTNMFVLNVEETLKKPSSQPVKVLIGEGDLLTIPSWQPVIPDETVEEMPVPLSTYNGLVAFTSGMEGGNLDIYTVYSDGSNLVNLTNNPAHDVNPFWSPDGKRIAFESDRIGSIQIFLMNADGSNVVQVTNGEANHRFENSSPWSPDGNRLLFTERALEDEQWKLFTVGVEGQNKTQLTQSPDMYSSASWSPDGTHIAYVVLEPVGDRNMVRIHVVDANGDNNTNVTSLLPEDEDLYSFYSWTQEGNIRFIANRYYWENDNAKYAFYEATLDGKTLVELTKTSTPLVDWWKGTTFVQGFTGETLTWLRSDGTYSEFKPYENCQMGSQPGYFGFSRRSSTGYLLYVAGCPDGDLWLYWVNPDGTDIRQILAAPIHATDGGLNDINWSPDSGHATLTVSTSGITYLYILDIREALKSPLSPPEPITIGGGDINYNISWQPIP